MASVKTAVSLDEDLFRSLDELAREMEVTRSHLVGLALREFIRQHQDRRLLDQISEAWADGLDDDETRVLKGMKRLHRKVLEREEGNEWTLGKETSTGSTSESR